MGVIILRESSSKCHFIYTGDNYTTTLKIDISDIIEQYPGGYGSIWWVYPNGIRSLLFTSVEDDTYIVATLGRDEISESGYYLVQGEWVNDNYIKKTPIFKLYVSKSLSDNSGDGENPIIIQPEYLEELRRLSSEVSENTSQVAQDKIDITTMKNSVIIMSQQVSRDASINTNPPRIGENGNWMIWDPDNNEYVDSGIKVNGIYVGTDTPPAGYDIWIDTTATITP